MNKSEITNTITDICNSFLERIKQEIDSPSLRRLRMNNYPSTFSVLGTDDFKLNNNNSYTRIIEACLRDIAINPIMDLLFKAYNYKVVWPYGRNTMFPSTWDVESRTPYEFILVDNKQVIGIRYTEIYEEDWNIIKIRKKFRLDKFIVVHWHELLEYEKSSQYIELISAVRFLDIYFGSDIANYVIHELQRVVKEARSEIGFQTIDILSPRNLSYFKNQKLKEYAEIHYSELTYQYVYENEKRNNKPLNEIPKSDLEIMDSFFVKRELFKCFVGIKGFSKCFITSEYLYGLFKEGNNFDYTAVVSGYLKSVEQIIYEILCAEVRLRPSKDVYIKRKSGNLRNYEYIKPVSVKNHITGAWQVPFEYKYQEYFDISLSPMIWLLHDHPEIWRISDEAKSIVHEYLLQYCKECRNDHFHKDNINFFESVKKIRNNTLLVFYFLLGGCKLSNSINSTYEILGIGGDDYTYLCNCLNNIKSSEMKFQLVYGEQKIKAIRLLNQQLVYDSNGRLDDTVFNFIEVNDYKAGRHDAINGNTEEYKKISITKDDIPNEIWLVMYNGDMKRIY